MQPDPNLHVDPLGRPANRGRATDRARGAVEDGEETVPGTPTCTWRACAPTSSAACGLFRGSAVALREPGLVEEISDGPAKGRTTR